MTVDQMEEHIEQINILEAELMGISDYVASVCLELVMDASFSNQDIRQLASMLFRRVDPSNLEVL